jgi:hypothetical protein
MLTIGQKILEEELKLQGWEFACFFADHEVWKKESHRILWHRKTEIINNILRYS